MGRNRGRDGLSGSRSGVANPKKIILAGRSWGGYLTLRHGSLVVDETIRQVEAQIAFAARHLGTRPPQ